ncbi:MAG: hypothetical protein WD738_06930 [Pirellulales bacterium]
MNSFKLILMAALWLGTIHQSAAARYRLTDLGDLPGGDNSSVALGLSEDGRFVVGRSSSDAGQRAFLWHNGNMMNLGTLEGTHNYSEARGVNNARQVVGTSLIEDVNGGQSGNRPFLYTNGSMQNLGSLGGDYGFANAINQVGQITGLSADQHGVTHVFLYSNGNITDIGDLSGGGNYSNGYGINHQGQIAGVSVGANGDRGFLWDGGPLIDLGDLPGGNNSSRAYAINSLGQVVGESGAAGSPIGHAFVWQDGTMTDLGVLSDGSHSSYALGINDTGMVVGKSYSDTSERAFVWDAVSGMHGLNQLLDGSGADWILLGAQAINNLGHVVGTGITPDGFQHGFLLTPIPEPSGLVLLNLAGITWICTRWIRLR